MAKAVLDILTRSASGIRSLDEHCRHRKPDGTSEIDLSRSHLNRILVGSADGVSASLKDWYKKTGAKKPAKQAETPYLTIVLSASRSHFENGNLEDFLEASMGWLAKEFGDELVYAELHLDETTPHIHAVVAPTFQKKKRVPGRQKKTETVDEFEARKEAARNHPGERQVGRSYHAWSGSGTFDAGRRRFCDATELDYGEQLTKGNGLTTRQWLKERAATNASHKDLVMKADKNLRRQKAHLDRREADIECRETEVERDRSELLKLKRSVGETLRRLKALVPWSKLSRSKSDALRSCLDEAQIGLDLVKPKKPENRKDRADSHDNQGVNIGM